MFVVEAIWIDRSGQCSFLIYVKTVAKNNRNNAERKILLKSFPNVHQKKAKPIHFKASIFSPVLQGEYTERMETHAFCIQKRHSASGFYVVPDIIIILGFVTTFVSKSSSLFLDLKDNFITCNLKIKPKEFMMKHSAFYKWHSLKTTVITHFIYNTQM